MNQPAPAAPALSPAQSTNSPVPRFVLAAITCPRCEGSGRLPQFRHVEAGRCFRCQGAGQLSVGRVA
ncbi:hypothetical protein ACFST9_01960 [Hymenobacter monticola]|uniref:Molecular chaperone DnaJ n=1 Tax=Hymenobacter monticola TaxID=1705399 RepID=A0ABY4B4P2_9BACT|nr:hypothetical protein [Hymenobacter monticola]UOE33272.1 hypothetical protein MTP16_19370 [Hymenobacter monticola]